MTAYCLFHKKLNVLGQNLNGYKNIVEDLCKRRPGQGILCGVKLAKTRIDFLKNELKYQKHVDIKLKFDCLLKSFF